MYKYKQSQTQIMYNTNEFIKVRQEDIVQVKLKQSTSTNNYN